MAMAVGMVMAAGMAMAVAEFADPATVRRPTVEGSCGAGGLSITRCYRLWRLLAMVQIWRVLSRRSGGVESGRRAGGVNSAGTFRWHLGASAMDALVDRVSEVKTLLRFRC
uniref:Secreted protein n=1 Tax=Oryza glumipatula TaxID=40148 RepID=A0A0D9ZZK2_9ORYZ